MVLTGRPCLG